MKNKIIKQILARQKDSKNTVIEEMDKIESLSWMDDNIRDVLLNNLSPEQMKKLDECGRANLAGQRIMTKAIKDALAKRES